MNKGGPPTIVPGEQLPYSNQPFLRRRIAWKMISIINMLLRARVVSPDKTVTGRLVYGSYGEMILELAAVTGATVSGVASQCYKVKSEQADYIVAGTWDGASLGAEVNIAKQWKLRASLASAVIDGNTWSYAYAGIYNTTSPVIRTATATISSVPYSLDERITPPYLVGDLIFPIITNYTGVTVGDPLTLVDICERAWASNKTSS